MTRSDIERLRDELMHRQGCDVDGTVEARSVDLCDTALAMIPVLEAAGRLDQNQADTYRDLWVPLMRAVNDYRTSPHRIGEVSV